MHGTSQNTTEHKAITKCDNAMWQGDTVALHNVYFVKYDVTVSFMAQVLDTVTYLVPQVLDTAS